VANPPKEPLTRLRGPVGVGGDNELGLPELDVEGELREHRDRLQNIEEALNSSSETTVSGGGGGGTTVLPTGFLTKPQADGLYSPLGHTHPTLPTVDQKAGLVHITAANYAVGINDIGDLDALLTATRFGFIFKEHVNAGSSNVLDVTQLLIDQPISDPAQGVTGLVLNDTVFIRASLTRRPVEANAFNVFANLRQSAPFIYTPPTDNATQLLQDYIAGGHNYVLNASNFVQGGGFLIVTTPSGPEVGTVTGVIGNTVTLSSLQGTGVGGLPAGVKCYHTKPGWGIVAHQPDTWTAGTSVGNILGMFPTATDRINVGDTVIINPGGLNQETIVVGAATYGLDPRAVTTVTFTTPLVNSHTANEPVMKLSVATQTPQPRRLFLDFLVREVGGAVIPFVMSNQLINLMIPYDFTLAGFPPNTLLAMAKFLHESGESGSSPAGDTPGDLIIQVGTGTFAGLSQPATIVHGLNLNLYAVMLTPRFDAQVPSLGDYGLDLTGITANQFVVRNTGSDNSTQFTYALLAIPPSAVYPPLIDANVGRFNPAGAVITHNRGVNAAQVFITVEPLYDSQIASIGQFAVDNVQANSFAVRQTGANATSQFRWAMFDTSALPLGKLRGVGTGTFAGGGSSATITHNLNVSGAYFVKIVPKFGPNLAAVGEYGVDPGTQTANAFQVKNTGVDNTTQFSWAIFVQ
jgi:hypothetical protein